jgi:hypothetical protein
MTERLHSCGELTCILLEKDRGVQCFEINPLHMTRNIPPPLTAKQTKGYSWKDILKVFEVTEIDDSAFDMWKGYEEEDLFGTRAEMKSRLETYTQYLSSSKGAPDVKNKASCIAFELKNYPEKYDAVGILMALAQNGGVCNVQKEIGIRSVYASMMDSMMAHTTENSVETKVLTLLKKNRLALSELVAESLIVHQVKNLTYSKLLNSHHVIPIQNKLASQIGIDPIPDPNASKEVQCEKAYVEFMKRYTVEHVVKVVYGAVNSSHRVIKYHDCVAFFEEIRPKGLDSYIYLNDFVFDMNTGKFTKAAIKYLLWKLEIIQVKQSVVRSSKKKSKTRELSVVPNFKKGFLLHLLLVYIALFLALTALKSYHVDSE